MNKENITPEGKGCIFAFFKILTTFFLIVIGLVIGLVILLAILFQCSGSPTTKTNFNESLISDMEKQFGITVMDNIELVKYTHTPSYWLDDNIEELEIKTDNYERFLKHNVNYEIKDLKVRKNTTITRDCKHYYSFNYDTKNYNISGSIWKNSDEDFYNIELWYSW